MMKKYKIFAALLPLLLLGILALVTLSLPHEIGFKIAHTKGDFQKAEKLFPKWDFISQNNNLGKLYQEGKYQEVEKKISQPLAKHCDFNKEKISEFCANIFYLEGLAKYQIGKEKKRKQQKLFFEQALSSFSKVITMTEEDSQEHIWAKENIEFIIKKFQENQKKEQEQKGSDEKNNQKQGEESSQENGKKQETEKDTQKQGEQGENSKDTPQEKTEQDSSQAEESRLPQQMQQDLEQIQKQLEENQKNSQKGFHRSKSAAEKNELQNQNPFNDPFFQQFFGNDPSFQDPSEGNKFHKQVQDPNLKDW